MSFKNQKPPPGSPVATPPVIFGGLEFRHSFWHARFFSLAAHALAVFLLFTVVKTVPVKVFTEDIVHIVGPIFLPETKLSGGGGGGDRSPTPPGKGELPKPAARQFVPPLPTPPREAVLVLPPTLVVPAEAELPRMKAPTWGDPTAKIDFPSGGPGSGGGIGSGSGGGIGPGKGPGYGPGFGGGTGGGVFRLGASGLVPPQLLYKIDPEYSEEARQSKVQGMVVLYAEVGRGGFAQNIKVMKGLGFGLDEAAIEAVKKWRFRPGLKDGKPVIVAVTVEVNFRLL